MGLFDRLFSEFVDVVEWIDDGHGSDDGAGRDVGRAMVYRFERYGNAIKYGATLIVRESQVAVFVNEGQIADVLGPGTYELETRNLPVLTTLQNWHRGFQSPFKAEVYFVSQRRFTDLKWGTRQPLMLRDREFGGLRVRAFGTYSVRIEDPTAFIREIVGTDGLFTTDEITGQLRNLITSRFAGIIGNADIPVLDLAASYDQLGEFLRERIAPEFAEYGLELIRLLVENVSLPESVAEALDKRTSLGMTGNLDRFLKYQAGQSMEAAAANPGGGAGEGLGMGVGLAIGRQMGDSFRQRETESAVSSQAAPGEPSGAADGEAGRMSSTSTPPPLPSATVFHVARDGQPSGPHTLAALRQQIDTGELTPDSLVWSPAFEDWQAAASVSELAPLFSTGREPPPIPAIS